jgi:hypothetical protein
MILRGERMPGTEDGARPGLCRRGHRRGVTAGTVDLRERGQPTWAAAARPSGLPPERARHGRRPGVGELAHHSPAAVLAVAAVSVTPPCSMTSRSCLRPGNRSGAGVPKARP